MNFRLILIPFIFGWSRVISQTKSKESTISLRHFYTLFFLLISIQNLSFNMTYSFTLWMRKILYLLGNLRVQYFILLCVTVVLKISYKLCLFIFDFRILDSNFLKKLLNNFLIFLMLWPHTTILTCSILLLFRNTTNWRALL